MNREALKTEISSTFLNADNRRSCRDKDILTSISAFSRPAEASNIPEHNNTYGAEDLLVIKTEKHLNRNTNAEKLT